MFCSLKPNLDNFTVLNLTTINSLIKPSDVLILDDMILYLKKGEIEI